MLLIPQKQALNKNTQGQNLFPTEETKNGDLALQSLAHVIKYVFLQITAP